MILIDKHGNKLELVEACPHCGSVNLKSGYIDAYCRDCYWEGLAVELVGLVEGLPIEREP